MGTKSVDTTTITRKGKGTPVVPKRTQRRGKRSKWINREDRNHNKEHETEEGTLMEELQVVNLSKRG